jgi:four helix bundle protein
MVVSGERKNLNAKSYRDLKVWQKSIELAREIYSTTREFPKDERFGLTNQVRRAGVSICSNIAEGQARRTTKDFVQFLYISRGSLAELDTQLTLSHKLGYLDEENYQKLLIQIDEIQRMLFSMIAKLGGSR